MIATISAIIKSLEAFGQKIRSSHLDFPPKQKKHSMQPPSGGEFVMMMMMMQGDDLAQVHQQEEEEDEEEGPNTNFGTPIPFLNTFLIGFLFFKVLG
jgi:hypothetical protein